MPKLVCDLLRSLSRGPRVARAGVTPVGSLLCYMEIRPRSLQSILTWKKQNKKKQTQVIIYLFLNQKRFRRNVSFQDFTLISFICWTKSWKTRAPSKRSAIPFAWKWPNEMMGIEASVLLEGFDDDSFWEGRLMLKIATEWNADGQAGRRKNGSNVRFSEQLRY